MEDHVPRSYYSEYINEKVEKEHLSRKLKEERLEKERLLTEIDIIKSKYERTLKDLNQKEYDDKLNYSMTATHEFVSY